MPQIYVKDELYHQIVGTGRVERHDVLRFIEEAIEEKLLGVKHQKEHNDRSD